MIDKKLARIFKNRWKLIEMIEKQDVRPATPEEKLAQLNTIFYIGSQLSLHRRNRPDSEELCAVRQRWARLKRAKGIEEA